MKIWHRFKAWILDRRIHRHHRELHKYVRRSAYEINAWQEDIAFLEENRRFHLSFLEKAPQPNEGKVVSIEEAQEAALEAMPPPKKSVG